MVVEGYDDEFYDEIDVWSQRSAAVVVPMVHGALAPTSVIDVGCGRGAWLAAFKSCGVTDVLGLDGDHVDVSRLHVAADEFRAVDLLSPPDLGRTYDLAISLEVAEHLPASSADAFVRFLAEAAPVVLFSGAIPGQGGVHHVNEQWPSYWAERFAAVGYRAVDALRPQVWNDERVGYFFAQNIVLFAHPDRVEAIETGLGAAWTLAAEPLAVVHPKMFEAVRAQARSGGRGSSPASLSSLLRQLPGATRRAVRSRLGGRHRG